jgi:hypothetical protein
LALTENSMARGQIAGLSCRSSFVGEESNY